EDGELLRLQIGDGKNRAGGALEIVAGTQPVHHLEPAIRDLRVAAARRDHGDVDALENLGDRDAGDAGDAPDGAHHRWIGRDLLSGRLADLRVALIVRVENLDLHAEDAALLVPLLDGELDRVRDLLALLGQRPGQGRPRRDLDNLLLG